MENFCFFIKTYSNDLKHLTILLDSIEKYNKDEIDIVLSVPEKEWDFFKNQLKDYKIKMIYKDEEISDDLFASNTNGFKSGYLNQQIIKLSFWKKSLYDFYLCLDSDTYFIRDFFIKDFFFDDDTPYSNLYEWENHFLDKDFIEWVDIYKNNLIKISNVIELNTDRIITSCNNVIFSKKVLESFEFFLIEKKLRFKDIIKICPFEFSWYNQWLIKSNLIRIIPVSGFFKVFHYRKIYKDIRRKLITEKDISKMYLGIVMHSNWKPIKSPLRYKNPNLLHYLLYRINKILFKLIILPYKIFINPRLPYYFEKYFKSKN